MTLICLKNDNQAEAKTIRVDRVARGMRIFVCLRRVEPWAGLSQLQASIESAPNVLGCILARFDFCFSFFKSRWGGENAHEHEAWIHAD